MSAFKKINSEKLTIIDHFTHERLIRNESIPCKIKNVKYKKSQRDFNLSDFITVKRKPRKRNTRYAYVIPKNKRIVKRKCRCRLSKLKKTILKSRLDRQNVERDNGGDTTIKSQVDSVADNLSNLVLNVDPKPNIHSRRFRCYCDNLSSKKLCSLVEKVLRELFFFQKRTYEINQYKGRYRRRIVIGFREVQTQLKLDKLKLVVIATDCEKSEIEGGLDSIIADIKSECKNKNVPCAFALLRRQISYALFIRSPISCVGIKNYDGVQDTFLSLLETLEEEKYNYKKTQENCE